MYSGDEENAQHTQYEALKYFYEFIEIIDDSIYFGIAT